MFIMYLYYLKSNGQSINKIENNKNKEQPKYRTLIIYNNKNMNINNIKEQKYRILIIQNNKNIEYK